jgi:hypothetical protein
VPAQLPPGSLRAERALLVPLAGAPCGSPLPFLLISPALGATASLQTHEQAHRPDPKATLPAAAAAAAAGKEIVTALVRASPARVPRCRLRLCLRPLLGGSGLPAACHRKKLAGGGWSLRIAQSETETVRWDLPIRKSSCFLHSPRPPKMRCTAWISHRWTEMVRWRPQSTQAESDREKQKPNEIFGANPTYTSYRNSVLRSFYNWVLPP